MNPIILALALTGCPQYPSLPVKGMDGKIFQTTDYSVIVAQHFWKSNPDQITQQAWTYDRWERFCLENEVRLLKRRIAEIETKK